MYNGTGVIIFPNNDRYEGEFTAGKRTGFATFTNSFDEKYTGQFVDAIRKGFGSYFWPGGDKYTGEWDNNMRNGYGILKKEGQDPETGMWFNGKLEKPEENSAVIVILKNKYPDIDILDD